MWSVDFVHFGGQVPVERHVSVGEGLSEEQCHGAH